MPQKNYRPPAPPLNSLRAFEAAARRQSFVLAAEELCVTPAAVAQQIKILEHWADQKLFNRKAKGVKLTSAGEMVRNDFITVFDHLGEAVQKLRSITSPTQIQIAALPSIAQFWLSPILPEIRKRFPEISISVSVTESLPNMRREPIDICLYFEDDADKLDEHTLTQDIIFPVCAPALEKTIKTRSGQQKIPLLHDYSWHQDWAIWLADNNEMSRSDTRGSVFSLYSLAIEEAKNGAGALIGHETLVNQYLKTGELVKPFNREVKLKRWLTMKLSSSHSVNHMVGEIAEFLQAKSRGKNVKRYG